MMYDYILTAARPSNNTMIEVLPVVEYSVQHNVDSIKPRSTTLSGQRFNRSLPNIVEVRV
jgi:hypothetical protein